MPDQLLGSQEKIDIGQPMAFQENGEAVRRYVTNASVIAFCLGVGFPVAAVWAAAWTTREGYLEGTAQMIAVWCSVGAACLASVICAAVVMLCAAVVTIRASCSQREPKSADANKGQGL